MTPPQIVAALDARRKELGWSQTRLAAECGMQRHLVCNHLNGRKVPSLDSVEKMARAMDLVLTLRA